MREKVEIAAFSMFEEKCRKSEKNVVFSVLMSIEHSRVKIKTIEKSKTIMQSKYVANF